MYYILDTMYFLILHLQSTIYDVLRCTTMYYYILNTTIYCLLYAIYHLFSLYIYIYIYIYICAHYIYHLPYTFCTLLHEDAEASYVWIVGSLGPKGLKGSGSEFKVQGLGFRSKA